MKKTALLFFTTLLLVFTSCKDNKKEITKEVEITNEATTSYVAYPDGTEIQWTAYKTTSKTPVSGVFKTINFNKKMGASPIEALHGLEFSIPISSLFSKNEERDGKLKVSFFGAMLSTEFLKGKISFNEANECNIEITMNGETKSIPFKYDIKDATVRLKGLMNLENWNALGAISSLNKVCFDLHKGEDGISKTWNDVIIEVETILEVL